MKNKIEKTSAKEWRKINTKKETKKTEEISEKSLKKHNPI